MEKLLAGLVGGLLVVLGALGVWFRRRRTDRDTSIGEARSDARTAGTIAEAGDARARADATAKQQAAEEEARRAAREAGAGSLAADLRRRNRGL